MHARSHWGCVIQLALLCHLLGQHAAAEQVTALFLGNSHTYFNDLPSLVQNLAASGGDTLLVNSNTPGGYTLAYPTNGHLYNTVSISLIEAGGWDYVVLQEHSQLPVIPYMRDNYMYPGIIALDSIIHENTPCCLTMLFMTWGWEHGGQHSFAGYTSPDFADYDEMQDSVRTSYMRIADSLGTPVAPAGVAWQNAMRDGFPLSLFNPDGYHPSLAGSYLAACVFYASFFQKSPSGLAFPAELSENHAHWLQAIADSTVLLDLSQWNITLHMPYSSFEYDWTLAERTKMTQRVIHSLIDIRNWLSPADINPRKDRWDVNRQPGAPNPQIQCLILQVPYEPLSQTSHRLSKRNRRDGSECEACD